MSMKVYQCSTINYKGEIWQDEDYGAYGIEVINDDSSHDSVFFANVDGKSQILQKDPDKLSKLLKDYFDYYESTSTNIELMGQEKGYWVYPISHDGYYKIHKGYEDQNNRICGFFYLDKRETFNFWKKYGPPDKIWEEQKFCKVFYDYCDDLIDRINKYSNDMFYSVHIINAIGDTIHEENGFESLESAIDSLNKEIKRSL